MAHRRASRLGGLAVLFVAWPLVAPADSTPNQSGGSSRAPAGKDLVTLSVRATSAARSKHSDGGSSEQDSILVTFTETAVFRITGSSDRVDLDLVSWRNHVTVEGGGTQVWGGDLPTVTWTYGPGTQPTSARGSLTLSRDGLHGSVNVEDFAFGARATVKAEEPWDQVAMRAFGLAKNGRDEALHSGSPTVVTPMRRQLDFTLPAQGNPRQVSGHGSADLRGLGDGFTSGTFTVDYTVTLGPPPPDEPRRRKRMTIVPLDRAAYEKWVPSPLFDRTSGRETVGVKAELHAAKPDDSKPSGRIDFTLRNVSRQRGECGNFPRSPSEKPDLRFAAEQPEGIQVDPDGQHAFTTEKVSEAVVMVASEDGGAWGGVQAVCKELRLTAEEPETARQELLVPKDDNDNHVADAWEEEKGILKENRPGEWDGDEVSGQDFKGDGITLFNEYRGLAFPEGKSGHTFRRLEPGTKEMFLLDSGNAFPMAKWEAITAIRAYRLNDSLVDPAGNPGPGESPLVNFNADDRGTHPFYALMIKVGPVPGECGPNPACAVLSLDGLPWCIRNAEAVYVDPSRFQLRIEEDYRWLDRAILQPDSAEGRELRNEGPAASIPLEDADRAWSLLANPDLRKRVAGKLQTAVFLHEVGHVVGTTDHESPPRGQEDVARSCLMFIQGDWGRRRTLVNTALGRGDPDLAYPYRGFCRDVRGPGYRCYRSLKVKDW